MSKQVAIGIQDFEKICENNLFYVDKTLFIKEWWETGDDVTLITRPRRFGKTLNMSMLNCFFSNQYADRGDLFESLNIWRYEEYRKLQGTYPVINLTFSAVKGSSYEKLSHMMKAVIWREYQQNCFLKETGLLNEQETMQFDSITHDMGDAEASDALLNLSNYLSRYYKKKVIILLDEYDTPLQEAYVGGCWDRMVEFVRSLFNAAFKSNPFMHRAVLTGITRISKESIFSELNHLSIVSTTSDLYADCFGFTEEEVFAALDEHGIPAKEDVKSMYDGFTFGSKTDIYNPWSIINYLRTGKLDVYWANTSSNGLVSKLLREGSARLKRDFEGLINGKSLKVVIDEQIVYDNIDDEEDAVWSLLLASGYLKMVSYECRLVDDEIETECELAITNLEVRSMFNKLIRGWFNGRCKGDYNDFVKALLNDNLEEMNYYMNRVAMETFSFFDSGSRPSDRTEPERFYHGFVLGLLVELRDIYQVKSNRESGMGRLDVMLIPRNKDMDGIIMEFKVFHPEKEKDLGDTVNAALKQIEEKGYDQELFDRGASSACIRRYGFAFEGKRVLIASSQ